MYFFLEYTPLTLQKMVKFKNAELDSNNSIAKLFLWDIYAALNVLQRISKDVYVYRFVGDVNS
jgi:hypothetical protein